MSWRNVVLYEMNEDMQSFTLICGRWPLLWLSKHRLVLHLLLLTMSRGSQSTWHNICVDLRVFMNIRNDVLFWSCVDDDLELRSDISRNRHSDTADGVRYAFKLRDVSNIDICSSWTHVNWQFESSSVQLVVIIEEIENCPSERYEFVILLLVRLWNLEFNHKVCGRMSLDVFEQMLDLKPNFILFRILQVWLSIVFLNHRWVDNSSVDVVDSINYSH